MLKSLLFCKGFFYFYDIYCYICFWNCFYMGTESQIIVTNLKSRIEKIISKYELALSENISLKEQLQKALVEIEEKDDKIKSLEQKVEQMQLADAFSATTGDVKEARKRIRKIVKEIDKCISMLND